MKSRSKSKCVGAKSDMISNLPENVTNQILILLPIRDAVRTSVLSTKWRYKWTTITELVFHEDSALPYPHDDKDKLINLIDRVLLLHSGFIHKFELCTSCLPNCSMIDAWILFLSRKNIKELVLEFYFWNDEEGYKLPSCFFSAEQICTMKLYNCILKPPPTFRGFSKLKILCLEETTFDDGGFECLISKCPILERLTLDGINGLDHLNIFSPNLKYLCLSGTFEDICFENTPLLSDVFICLTENITDEKFEKFRQSETGNVVKVLSSLPNLKKFGMGLYILEFLAVGKILEKLPFTCDYLYKLSLDLNFKYVNEICVTLCLLNSSPNLRELEIRSCPSDEPARDIENFWGKRTHIDWKMCGLQVVKFTNFTGFEFELEFIKLLLGNSPMLEMLSVRSFKQDIIDCDGLKFLKELLIFPRASPKARIKFLERNEK